MTRKNGDRLVRLTNGREYVQQANTTFGIIRLGAKETALQYTLADAVGILRDLNIYRANGEKLYAELV
jgi:hypothetical protein